MNLCFSLIYSQIALEIHSDPAGRIKFSNFPDSSLKNSSQKWDNLLPFEPMSLTVNTADGHQGEGFFGPTVSMKM